MRIIRRHPRVALVIAVFVLVALWAAFRPELLFVNKHVDEPLPGATSAVAIPYVPA